MRIITSTLILAVLACATNSAQAQDIPQLSSLPIPAFVWTLLNFMLSWKDTENTFTATHASLGLDGVYASDAAGTVKMYADKEWTAFDTAKFFYIPTLMGGGIWWDETDDKVKMSVGSSEVESPALTGCTPVALTANMMMAISIIDCNNEIKTLDLDVPSWDTVAFVVSGSPTPVSISADNADGLWVVDSNGKVWVKVGTADWV